MDAQKKFIQNIAANIKQIRLSKHYTQEYMAYKLAVSQNTYSKIELSAIKLTIDRFFEIAVILDTSVADLMNPRLVIQIVPKERAVPKINTGRLRKAQRKNTT